MSNCKLPLKFDDIMTIFEEVDDLCADIMYEIDLAPANVLIDHGAALYGRPMDLNPRLINKLYGVRQTVGNDTPIVYYLTALIKYLSFYELCLDKGRRESICVGNDPDQAELKDELNSIIEELNKGKDSLSKEDKINIEFFNKCIEYIHNHEIKKINHCVENYRIRKEQEKIEKYREENKLCIKCGEKLGFFDKLFDYKTCKKHRK